MQHFKSVFNNEQELLKAIISLHLNGKDIELDPMFNHGAFYKDGVNKPKYTFDIAPNPLYHTNYGDAKNLFFRNNDIESMILDPPFMFGIHGKTLENTCVKRYTMYDSLKTLEFEYKQILIESYRILKPDGILIFKCQDYTDSKTTMTHCLVYNWAVDLGFYAKDLAILNKEHKIFNGNTKQRHLRKTHTYFWVFQKK